MEDWKFGSICHLSTTIIFVYKQYSMDISLIGKTAVICGSSQGIGLATAKELAVNGANCILIARNAEALQTAVAQLIERGISITSGLLPILRIRIPLKMRLKKL